ncbi:hypothetical protein [Actinoplanes sp. NPDC026623]|uniref:hypothetical protein n=1 Tax=Actinoplanes sp. NPDC026623 TaxID=3155610 RepID=UPI0033F4FC9A
MSARTFTILAAGAGLVLSVAGCSEAKPSAAAAPTSAPSSAPAATAQATTAPPTNVPADSAAPACPVSEKTLLAAFETHYDKKAPKGTRMTRIVCFKSYAIAGFEPLKQESEIQTFKYASGSWTFDSGTNDGYCIGLPADVKKYFGGHGWPNCALTPSPA